MSFFKWRDINLAAGNIEIKKIISVNHEGMVANVEGVSEQVPIHFHCDEEDITDNKKDWTEAYPDEMDEGGSLAFAKDDEVLVLYRGAGNTKPVIIGHSGQVKGCCSFRFKLIGSDGPELNENVFFTAYNRSAENIPILGLEYNEEEEYWEFILDSDSEVEFSNCSDKYWVSYLKAGYKATQYKGRNTEAAKWKDGDLIESSRDTRFDILEILEGEVGYWEDWSEGICGKNNWSWLLVFAMGGGTSERVAAPCAEPPHNLSAGSTIASLVLTGDVYSTVASTQSDLYNISVAYSSIGISGGMPWFPGKKFILNFAEVPAGETTGDFSTSAVDARIVLTFGGEDERFDLYLYFVFENWEGKGSQALMDTYTNPGGGDKYVWMGDDVVAGKDLEVDFFDPRFEVPDTMASLDFMGLYTASSDGGISSWSIDYIDFPKWEPWDDSEDAPELCKNNFWVILGLDYSEMSCSPDLLPIHATDSWNGHDTATYDIDITNGIMSWNINTFYDMNTNIYFYWDARNEENEEAKKITGVTKLILKVTAQAVSADRSEWHADEKDAWTIEIGCSSGEGPSVELWLAGAYPGDYSPSQWIGTNDGEEMEIDLTQYGFTSESKIRDFYFEYTYKTDNGLGSVSLTCDYIDFR